MERYFWMTVGREMRRLRLGESGFGGRMRRRGLRARCAGVIYMFIVRICAVWDREGCVP